MRYAKLINTYPSYAPNPILIGGNNIWNAPGSVYEAEGYKPVTFTVPPYNPDEGYMWVETWTETPEEILQEWRQVEKTDYDGDEAMDFIFGGEN